MFLLEAKSIEGTKIWQQSEVIAALNTVIVSTARLLAYLPETRECEAYKAGAVDMLETIGSMFGLRRVEDGN